MAQFKVGERVISEEHQPFIIAEVGINHNGSLETAKKMIQVALDAGVDAVKFQTFTAEEFCGDPKQLFTYKSQGKSVTEPMLDMFKRYEFEESVWQEIKNYCDSIGITFFSTPQNESDLDLLLQIGVPAIKVGSDDITNLPLLRSYAKSKLPIILSCGMSDISEVHQALEQVGWFEGAQVSMLLCTSQYPTPPEDVNIRKITTLRNTFPGLLVGFSDHTQGSCAAIMAVALGARVFEKHFTLDNDMPGPDHWFSENPESLASWVKSIRSSYTMLGSAFVKPTDKEMDMRVLARRSVVALCDIDANETFDTDKIGLRRPGDGLPPIVIDQLLGLKASCSIRRGQKISLKDIKS